MKTTNLTLILLAAAPTAATSTTPKAPSTPTTALTKPLLDLKHVAIAPYLHLI